MKKEGKLKKEGKKNNGSGSPIKISQLKTCT